LDFKQVQFIFFYIKYMQGDINITKKFKKISISIIVLLAMLLSFASGMYMAERNNAVNQLAKKEAAYVGDVTGIHSDALDVKLSKDVDFKLFWQVWDKLKEKYVDKSKINDKQLFYGAIRGMVASVGDPYTVFMDPKISTEFSQDLAGTFEGIGAEVGIKNNTLTIIAPLPDMPAEKAGLRSGDKIISIDKTSTANLTVDEAVNKIRGPKGTEVTLSIFREGFEKPKDYVIKRDKIIVKSVRTTFRPDKVFVIEITNFNDDTLNLFNDAVNEALKDNPKGIILDLRNDPGGYLETAIEVASEWVDNGVIVSEAFTDQKKNDYLSRGRARLKDVRTVVLVNQGSASASEIVAGALQDHGKATIIGKQTFGKGSVQTLEDFSDGSSLKVTVAKWLTPKGNNITEKGITPDIAVDLTEQDYNANKDPQLNKALEVLGVQKAIDNSVKSSSTPSKK
jgi:carboxyl-terminal processing protease